ncbi:hypothetical protein L6452_31009 [Arctium lappa]|uniref:Uncharacterized protein n=1 Tax=Arctium lappa TaxID=4217 RepID=A0ACB8ZK70_ARCLA|nr:hypothetical protein L6452_31009 [Arctium lappa]
MDIMNSKNEVGRGNISLSENVISSRYGSDVRKRIETVDVVVDPDGGWNEEVVGGNSAEGGDLYGLKDGTGGGRFGEKKVSDAYGCGSYRLEEKPLHT